MEKKREATMMGFLGLRVKDFFKQNRGGPISTSPSSSVYVYPHNVCAYSCVCVPIHVDICVYMCMYMFYVDMRTHVQRYVHRYICTSIFTCA